VIGDLKLVNAGFDDDGILKILDFGLTSVIPFDFKLAGNIGTYFSI
jgi:serine/threonine protein kinase